MSWFERYQDAMWRTRSASIIGASMMVFSMLAEGWGHIQRLRLAEDLALISPEVRRDLTELGILLTLLIAVFVWRILVLTLGSRARYGHTLMTSVSAFAVACIYIRWKLGVLYGPGPSVIYDLASALDWSGVATLLYVPLSVFRVVVTSMYTAFQQSYK